jgi:hypothetical protein
LDDFSNKISDFLSSPDAMDKVRNVLSMLQQNPGSSSEPSREPGPPPPGGENPLENVETLMKIKNLYSQLSSSRDDPKLNLLYALKPYLGPKRLEKFDQVTRMVKLAKLSELFTKNFDL